MSGPSLLARCRSLKPNWRGLSRRPCTNEEIALYSAARALNGAKVVSSQSTATGKVVARAAVNYLRAGLYRKERNT
jgi:hypothetical protein